MPAPANSNELLDFIQKSGVVEEPKLRAYIQKLGANMPAEPAKLAGLLVRDAVLTYFQAEQLLQGKYKRFSIGKYKVLEKLGAGGMAQVFLCEHKLMRRRVAIKVLPTAKADDPASLNRFYREAKAIAAVDHPNIVRAYDIDQDENLHFLVMEYVDGTNLQDLVKKFGPVEVLRACHYIYGASVGLQHAHEIGLVHRDIKPGNILIDRSGVVKILDMGLARFFYDEEDALTKKYDENVLGTADYLAPEQALDSHTVDIRADIYSLGATFYYLLTASALFPEGSVAQKLIWHQNRQPRPLRSLRPDVPEELAAIIEKMMAKEPARRYQTPAEIMAVLAPWVATPIPPPAEREMPQVSPAAGGSGGRGPATSVGVGRGPSPDAPTVVATVQATPTHPIATIPSTASAAPGAEVWESLDSDTQSVARGDTDRPNGRPEPASRSGRHQKTKPGGFPTLLVGACALAVAGAVAGAYFAFFNKSTVSDKPVGGPQRIVVSKSGGDAATLQEALNRVGDGDTIAIADERIEEAAPLIVSRNRRHKNVTIESALPDRSAVIVFGRIPPQAQALLLDSIEGVRLRNLEIEGKEELPVGIKIVGVCQGLTIENVTVKNARTGVWLSNASGTSEKRIALDRIRIVGRTGGTALNATSAPNLRTDWVTIANSRFEGPAKDNPLKDGIRIEGPSANLRIADSRFFNLANAFWFGRPDKDRIIGAQIANNTVASVKDAGILFDMNLQPPPKEPKDQPPSGKYDVFVTANYFTDFSDAAEIGRLVGQNPNMQSEVKWKDNAQGPGCKNLGIATGLQAAPANVDSTDPNSDARFLRFTSRPAVNGQPVGAP